MDIRDHNAPAPIACTIYTIDGPLPGKVYLPSGDKTAARAYVETDDKLHGAFVRADIAKRKAEEG